MRTLPGAVVPQVASEWLLLYVSSVTIQTLTWRKFVGKTWNTLQNHRTGKFGVGRCMEMGACLGALQYKSCMRDSSCALETTFRIGSWSVAPTQ